MNRTARVCIYVSAIMVASACCSPLFAQPVRRNPADLNVSTVTRPFRAAYLIEPLIHQVTARRGQLVKFQFRIAANAKGSKLNISPVAMKQQPNGAMVLDKESVPPTVLKVTSASDVDLALAEFHTIECELRVPPVNTPFLTYGVLVRELPTDEDPEDQNTQPTIGVKFLTQYLLRVELEVLGVTGQSAERIEIEAGRLAERDGNAIVQAIVRNPTDSSMAFQLRSELVSRASGKRVRSGLHMVCRSNMEPPQKYRSKILGKTQLIMEGQLSDAVFPGEYELLLEVLHNSRVYSRKSFDVSIRAGDFPAQDASIVRVTRDISVEPANICLSLRKGGKRMQALAIENNSQQVVIAHLESKENIGQLSESLSFRPEQISLAPGRSRKVLVMLGRKRDFVDHSYAFAELTVRPEEGEAIGRQLIPIALLTNSDAEPQVEAGELTWAIRGRKAGFEIPIENTGRRHLELASRMSMLDEFGRGFNVEDGYGRWILPGAKDSLWFPLPQSPPPGRYELRVEVDRGELLEPFTIRKNVELQTPNPQTSQRTSTNPRQ